MSDFAVFFREAPQNEPPTANRTFARFGSVRRIMRRWDRREVGSHGRSELSSEARCFICHTVDTCKTCHNHPPETHTREFMHPGSNSTEALRHIVLARARPSSCMVCHQEFVSSCSKCHGSSEVFDWYEYGEADLARWPSLLKSLRVRPGAETAP